LEKLAIAGSGRQSLSFAPDGIFEFRAALRKAIASAQTYIYIEDQAFSAIEVMEWINARLRANAALKVILVWGRDPGDPSTPFFHQAISNRLIAGVSDAAARVHVFERQAIIVHTKITIIDDAWAAIGSANCTRRSLLADGELSVSVMDSAPIPFAQRLRADLWGELCGLPPGAARDPLLDFGFAITVVEEAATRTGPPPPGGTHFAGNVVRLRLPLEYADPPAFGQLKGTGAPVFDQFEYDVKEPDSR
jgi:phosphatidylserine/phosphatidylglycerophosphate/cardiolipin synthase-like enzyme